MTDPPLHHHLETDSPLHHYLEMDSPLHHHLETDSPLHHHLETDPPLHHHLETDSLLHHYLEMDSPLLNHLKMDSPLHHYLEMDSPLHYHLPTDSPLHHHSEMASPLIINMPYPPSSLGDRPSPPNLSGFQQTIEENLGTNELFEPLYAGAYITVGGAYCCIMHFASTNKLTYTAISELRNLLKLICPPESKLPSSFYKLKKFF